MLIRIIVVIFYSYFIITPVIAQQYPPSTATDRIASHIGNLVLQIEQLKDQNLTLQDQLSKAQAKIKELEDGTKTPSKEK